jgi:hypothetical protein
MRIAKSFLLTLCVLLMALAQARAQSDSDLEVPAPSNQNGAPIAPARPPTPRPRPGGTLVLPQAPPPVVVVPAPVQPYQPAPAYAPPPPPPQAQFRPPSPPPPPPLPEIFRGCWQGVVEQLDSIQRLPGARPVGPWVAKTYRLCYRRIGNGPFELTFADAGMMHSSLITNSQGHLQVISTDGRSFAELRAILQFQEYALGSRSGRTFNVDELTNLSARIDQGTMRVNASVYGEHGGSPWFRASWHATFTHTPD